jgi:hypothetical protein
MIGDLIQRRGGRECREQDISIWGMPQNVAGLRAIVAWQPHEGLTAYQLIYWFQPTESCGRGKDIGVHSAQSSHDSPACGRIKYYCEFPIIQEPTDDDIILRFCLGVLILKNWKVWLLSQSNQLSIASSKSHKKISFMLFNDSISFHKLGSCSMGL